jgi:MFS family permease
MLTPTYKRYALFLFTTVCTVNMFDRGLMGLLLEPIKRDLGLSDTQLGLLTGMAYALFYATAGVPIGIWADRGNRVTITSLTLGLWSLVNMAFAAVTNYAQLLVLRVFAAIGDVGCTPPIYSLLGDYFPGRAERTRAMYVWYLAGPLSALISVTAAGWLNERYGWRQAFFLTGLIGLPLAILSKLTILEPRANRPVHPVHDRALPPMAAVNAVLALLWRRRSCRHLVLALIVMTIIGHGLGSWQAAFMIRHHEIGTSELGVWIGVIGGLGGLISILLGAWIMGRWFAENDSGQMWLAAAALASGAPIYIAFLLLPTKDQALTMLLLQALVFGAFLISPTVMLQRLVPESMRATVLVVVGLLTNLIGYGTGPLVVGSLSDLLAGRFGPVDGLRYAMLLGAVGYLWSSYHFIRVTRTLDRDLLKAAQHEAQVDRRRIDARSEVIGHQDSPA